MIARLIALLVAFTAVVPAFGALPPWIRAAVPAQMPETKDARSVVLLDDTAVTVFPNGEVSTRHRRVVKILTAAGREDLATGVWFDNDSKVKALHGWSIDRNGTEYTLKQRDAVEASAGDFELYTDARMKVLRVPGDIGSVVAFESERVEKPYLMQSAWHFQEDIPVLHARYQLTLPAGWSLHAKWMNHEPVAPLTPGVWEIKSIPAIADEPRRPSVLAIGGRAGFDFLKPSAQPLSWSDIAKWFGSLAAPRALPTPELQAKVRELTANAKDPIRPLARFAQRDVRYIAVEVGIGGYQPHAAGEVFSKRFGDCKDKTTLLRTMLKEAGIDAYAVLVHATRGATDPAFPSMHAFNHVIAAIPVSAEKAKELHAVVDHPKLGKLLLFDPTSTLTPYGHLPESLQASRGLLVTKEGGELIELPTQTPEASQLRRSAKLALAPNGTLSGTVEEVRSGSMAAGMRSYLQSMDANERIGYVESTLASHMAASNAADIAIEHLDDPEADLVIRYKVTAPLYAKRVANMLLVRPRVIGQKSETLVDTKRTYTYVTDGPSLQIDEIDITMPPAMTLDELPAKVEAKTKVAEYASSSTFEQGVLRYRRRYALHSFSVPKDGLAEVNGVWTKILSDERASAVFK